MNSKLPDERDIICQRLTDEWILTLSTVEKQIDGCATIISTLVDVLDPLLGRVATRAILSRTSIVVRRRYLLLATVAMKETGLDQASLKKELLIENPAESREALAGLICTLLEILNGLIGRSIMPILRDLEAELAAKQVEPLNDEEGS